MSESIFKDVTNSNLDKELEGILLKILRYNMSSSMTGPIREFLKEYGEIHETFWSQFAKSNSFDGAFDSYYQYSKNKCMLVENLLDSLNFSLNSKSIREDATLMLKEALTF